MTWAALIPLFPLIGFAILGGSGSKLSKGAAGFLASASVFISFLFSIAVFAQVLGSPVAAFKVQIFDWIQIGSYNLGFSFLFDRLSAVMLLVVTGVGFLIHVYSIGYMHEDNDFNRFFAYLNLFIFFMLLLVLGSNFLVLFAGWEGVGLCSYLLIGFWFSNNEYNAAARKAFVMNRIGDLAFLIALLLLFYNFNSLEFDVVFSQASSIGAGDQLLFIISILLFIGATGKSAQIPLFTWLPDAMAGPTPVSALIHAATMVTAGIYMVIRANVLFVLSPMTSEIIMWIGVATAFMAATIGLKQNDIKKVLAYSTVSQLGYMFVALGVGAYSTALFHVVMHAFFKALLFLGAGSVIHAMGGEQNIRFMGGLKGKLRITHITFLIATLAISGIPPLAGFFSKDEILAVTHSHSMVVFTLLAICSVFTAVYMFRLYWLVFHGNFRGSADQQSHLHESPMSMTFPLIVLAVLSTIGGFIGMPSIFHTPHYFNEYLMPMLNMQAHELSHSFEYMLIGVSIVALVIIVWGTYNYYVKNNNVPIDESEEKGLQKIIQGKYYIDELYESIIRTPLQKLSLFLHNIIDQGVIDRIINGSGLFTLSFAGVLRIIQSGSLGFYLFAMVIGIIVLIALSFFLLM